jgi:hypothetical protein
MNTNLKKQMVTCEGSRLASAEQRLKELGIKPPAPSEPFGTYVEAAQTGNLLFLSGMLPTEDHGAKLIGRVGAALDVEAAPTMLTSGIQRRLIREYRSKLGTTGSWRVSLSAQAVGGVSRPFSPNLRKSWPAFLASLCLGVA